MLTHTLLGRTSLSVGRLGLGTVELGMDYGIQSPGHFGRPGEQEAIAVVHAALEAGVNFIDTARGYGESERVVGLALRDRRDAAVLATKVATQLPDGSTPVGADLSGHMVSSLHKSLAALKTDYVDIWQIHNVDQPLLAQAEVVADVFDRARQAGKVRSLGGSFYGHQLPATQVARDLFDTMQVTYSVLDQRAEDHFLPVATRNKVGVIARSVLLKGALTERAEDLPERLAPLRDRSRRFRQLVADSDLALSPAQAAIAFALSEERIGVVLTGVRSVAELSENLRAAETELPLELLVALRDLRMDDEQILNPATWDVP